MNDWLVPDPDEAFELWFEKVIRTHGHIVEGHESAKFAFEAGRLWEQNNNAFKHWKEKEEG